MVTGRLAKREAELRDYIARQPPSPEDPMLVSHIDGITTARVMVEGLRKKLVAQGRIDE